MFEASVQYLVTSALIPASPFISILIGFTAGKIAGSASETFIRPALVRAAKTELFLFNQAESNYGPWASLYSQSNMILGR